MPDEHYDDEQDNESSVIRELRRELKQAKADAAEVSTLRQEAAILRAGITDLTPAKQKALLAAHEGDLSAEALRQTATDLGFIAEAPQSEPEPQVPVEEQQALQAMAAATAAADPSEAHLKTLDDAIRAAKSPEELAEILDRAGLLLHDE